MYKPLLPHTEHSTTHLWHYAPAPQGSPTPLSPPSNHHTAPQQGSCPIWNLPDELWLECLSYLDWEDFAAIRPVCRRFAELALSPPLHRTQNLHNLPLHPLPPVFVDRILPLVRHLTLHFVPSPVSYGRLRPGGPGLVNLLKAIPEDSLVSLSIPFSSHYVAWHEIGSELVRIAGRLESLDLRSSGLVMGKWLTAIAKVAPRLKHLDLGGNRLFFIPPLGPSVETLSFKGCTCIPAPLLTWFLSQLPLSLRKLDLSELSQLTLPALEGMRVADTKRSALEEIRLIGVDHLTRGNVRALQAHWARQRAACDVPAPGWAMPSGPGPMTPPPSPPMGSAPRWIPGRETTAKPEVWMPHTPPRDGEMLPREDRITIVHSALLESDDEEGYRRFIGEVVGGTLDWGCGVGGERYLVQ